MDRGDLAPWRVLPGFIVRPAGFAFARLAALRFERAVAASEALAAAAAARVAAGHAFDHAVSQERYGDVAELDDPAARKQFSRHIKRARAFARAAPADDEPPTAALAEIVRLVPAVAAPAAALADHHARWRAAHHAFAAVFAAELDERRAAMRAAYAGDERLREAVFLESPEAFERVAQLIAEPGPRDARARQRERLAAMYLQRFCAKNDTNSICGPHAVAWLTDADTDANTALARPTIEIAAGGEHRRAYFSHWAAERLFAAACARAGEAEVVAIHPHPTLRLDGASAAWCVIAHDATVALHRRYRRAALPDAARDLLQLLAHRPRARAAIAAGELGLDDDELAELLAELADAGAIVRAPHLPPGLFRPLDHVRDELARWPGGAALPEHDHARALAALVDDFARAGFAARRAIYHQLVERFHAATGEAAQRGAGRHYADRSILHEDCHADVRARVGRETIDPVLAALVPLVDAAALPLELARASVRAWFRARFGAGVRVPALDAHRAFDDEHAAAYPLATAEGDALRAAIERVRACFAAAVDAAPGGPARVASHALAAALDGAPRRRAGYVSVDLMLRARPDAPPLPVLGEVHGFFWLPTCLLDVVPEPDRSAIVDHMRDAMRALAGGRPTAECVFAHTQATDRRFPLTDADLALVAPGDERAIAFGRLDLVLDGDDLRFFDGEREIVPVTAYTTYPFLLYTSRLAPLIDDFAGRFFPEALLPDAVRTGDGPRMQVDDLVFRRRTWRRPARMLQAALGADKDGPLFLRAQALRAELACPAVVFASFPDEPKPIVVDFASLFLVETFAHLVARQAGDAVVRLGEMLPGPDELLSHGPDGARTSELRLGFYRLAT